MKKHTIFLFLLLLIILCVKSNHSYAFDNIVNYNNDNYTLITKILKDTNKDNLIPYIDLISLQTIDCIPNDNKNKIAYTVSLPQQTSFIAIYTYDKSNHLVFQGIIDNLSNIENFYYYKDFIVVEQSDSTTNFTQRNFVELFYKKNDNYISVFNKDIYSEKVINNGSNENVTKKLETASIDYLEGSSPRIICINTTTLYKGYLVNLSNNYEFKEENKSTTKEIYEWSNDIECFTIKKEP